MKVTVDKEGTVRHVYSDHINLQSLGAGMITRASQVEPINNKWYVYLDGSLVAGPFEKRQEAIDWEVRHIESCLL